MPSVYEKCSCGAEMDLRDAHYEQCKWLMKQWRYEHKHEHFPQAPTDSHFVVDASRSETPMGFTRGLRGDLPDIDIDDDPENRRKRRNG